MPFQVVRLVETVRHYLAFICYAVAIGIRQANHRAGAALRRIEIAVRANCHHAWPLQAAEEGVELEAGGNMEPGRSFIIGGGLLASCWCGGNGTIAGRGCVCRRAGTSARQQGEKSEPCAYRKT